jgi:hypothetical protein
MLRKGEEMSAFRRRELQAARQILEEGGRDLYLPPLFQPCVPGEPDTRERGHLFPSQPANPAALAGG